MMMELLAGDGENAADEGAVLRQEDEDELEELYRERNSAPT